jgi:hypothetical protein
VIKEGDIFYAEWGWEQTNVDFYQVLKVSGQMVTLREVEQRFTKRNDVGMVGRVVAEPGKFMADKAAFRRRLKDSRFDGKPEVKVDSCRGWARQDEPGKEHSISWYG